VARNLRADFLVLGNHSQRGVLHVALGGTARQVSRDAPCPVVLGIAPSTKSVITTISAKTPNLDG
jgi:hypothetical protein